MATDINTQLQNISTDVTAIGNLVNRLTTIFSVGGVQNPDIATAKAELQAFASNAGNITTGVLAAAYGGTGRTDGMVTDVYATDVNKKLSDLGRIGYAKRYSSEQVDSIISLPSEVYIGTSGQSYANVNWGFVSTKAVTNNTAVQEYYGINPSYMSYMIRTKQGDWSAWYYLNLYIDTYKIFISKNGNDTNLGTTQDTAVQTVAEAFKRAHNVHCNKLIFDFLDGNWGNITLSGANFSAVEIEITSSTGNADINYLLIKDVYLNISKITISTITVDASAFLRIYTGVSVASINTNGIVSLISGQTLNILNATAFDASAPLNAVFNVYGHGTLSLLGILNFAAGTNVQTYFLQVNEVGYAYINLNEVIGEFTGKKYNIGDSCLLKGFDPSAYPGVASSSNAFYRHGASFSTLVPYKDNTFSLGTGSARWTQVFAGTATINTSDERDKENINEIPENVLKAWGEVQFSQFQFKDSVREKGDKARLHTGLIAQRILTVFKKYNLDATKYGLLCYDSWEEKDYDVVVGKEPAKYEMVKVVDEAATEDLPEKFHYEERLVEAERDITEHHHEDAGDRYGLRYEEALCMEVAYQRWKNAKLEARLAALEAKVK